MQSAKNADGESTGTYHDLIVFGGLGMSEPVGLSPFGSGWERSVT